MELAKYKACICEGSAEEAIIDILVDNDLLIFSNPQTLVKAIKEYRRTANIPKGEYSLSDLLR